LLWTRIGRVHRTPEVLIQTVVHRQASDEPMPAEPSIRMHYSVCYPCWKRQAKQCLLLCQGWPRGPASAHRPGPCMHLDCSTIASKALPVFAADEGAQEGWSIFQWEASQGLMKAGAQLQRRPAPSCAQRLHTHAALGWLHPSNTYVHEARAAAPACMTPPAPGAVGYA
jgi:hypothetical protein